MTTANLKLAPWNRLVKQAIGKVWGGVENRWIVWPWPSSAIYVWERQPSISNMSGQFDELIIHKMHFKVQQAAESRRNKNKKTVKLLNSESVQSGNAASCCAYMLFVSLTPTTKWKDSSLQEASWTKCCTSGLNSKFHSVLQGRMEIAAVDPGVLQIYSCTCAALLFYKWMTVRSSAI